MKKFLLLMFVFLLSFGLFSMVVDSTATMNNTELQQLYDACEGGDVVFTAMYGWYQSDNRDGEEIDWLETKSYKSIGLAGSYLELAFEGIIDA